MVPQWDLYGETLRFQIPPICLLESVVKIPLPDSPLWPLWREMPVFGALFYKSLGAPLHGSPVERDVLFPEPVVYSFIHISQSPQLRMSPTKW
jgi:hypothetical protein